MVRIRRVVEQDLRLFRVLEFTLEQPRTLVLQRRAGGTGIERDFVSAFRRRWLQTSFTKRSCSRSKFQERWSFSLAHFGFAAVCVCFSSCWVHSCREAVEGNNAGEVGSCLS